MALEEDDGGGGDIPEWVVTFGDMMSLLLTFFIMLVSLSEIKQEEKYQAMVESLTQRFGYDRSPANPMRRARIGSCRRNRFNSSASSSAEAYPCAGSFSRHFRQMFSSDFGIEPSS